MALATEAERQLFARAVWTWRTTPPRSRWRASMRLGLSQEREAIRIAPDVERASRAAARIQHEHPPPIRAIVVSRATGEVGRVIPNDPQSLASQRLGDAGAACVVSRGTSRENRPRS